MQPAVPVAVPVKSGLGPIAWTVIILGGLFAIFLVVVVAGGLFVVHKVKQAGFDPDLMRKNPTLAMTKFVTATNPNVEVISVDDNKGIIHIRDKQTGKSMTMSFADAKAGKFVVQEDGKEAVTITATGDGNNGKVVVQDGKGQQATITATGDGQNGTVQVQTADGVQTMGIGAAAKTPDWIPNYPDSQPQGLMGAQSAQSNSGAFHFVTKDPVDKVSEFYKDKFTAAGLKVASSTNTSTDGTMSGTVGGEDEAKNRQATALFSGGPDGTNVTVTFQEKK